MAYVSISANLVTCTKGIIETLRNKELMTQPADKHTAAVETSSEIYNMIYDRAYGDCLDLKDRLKQFDTPCSIPLYINYRSADGVMRIVRANLTKQNIPCTAKKTGYTHDEHKVELTPLDHPLLAALAAADEARADICKRWATVSNQIVTYLESCKSLNEALKKWPDVRRYISKEFLDRVERKVATGGSSASGADEALKDIDMDMVQTSTVLARMSGAQI